MPRSPRTKSLTCCYFGCTRIRGHGRTTFFNFPIFNPARCRKWIKNSNNAHFIHLYNSSRKLLEKYSICDNHFDDEDFVKYQGYRKELLWNAVPKKYVPHNGETLQQSSDSENENDMFYNRTDIGEDNKLLNYESIYLPESGQVDLKPLRVAPSTSLCKPKQYTRLQATPTPRATHSQDCHDPLDLLDESTLQVYKDNAISVPEQRHSKRTQTTHVSTDPFIDEVARQFNKLTDKRLKKTVKSEILLLLYNAHKKEIGFIVD